MNMKVASMISPNGNAIANQFIITEHIGERVNIETFQSYDSTIASITWNHGTRTVELDENYWDYSQTTAKYRRQFLGENKKETVAKIDSGEYKLVNLNK